MRAIKDPPPTPDLYPFIFFLALTAFPCLLNAMGLCGILKTDPALLISGLGHIMKKGFNGGWPTLETGGAGQAITRVVVGELARGRFMWWNHDMGLGTPMIESPWTAPFFPPSWLLLLPHGTLLLGIFLQLISGLGTYFLLRRINIGRWAALAGGILYESNGTFAWLSGPAVNPIPFLPWLLLGLEKAKLAAQKNERGGWFLAAGSLALSLYAGFPQIAYLNGLLAAAWGALRFAQCAPEVRTAFARKVVWGTFVGLLVAAPSISLFLNYMPYAYLDLHGQSLGYSNFTIPPVYFAQLVLPYLAGPLSFWGQTLLAPILTFNPTEGYAPLGAVMMALCAAMASRKESALRRLMGGWIIWSLAASFGVPVAHGLLMLVPGVKFSSYFQNLTPSWELCLCLLAAFAIDDFEFLPLSKKRLFAGRGMIAVLVLISLGILLPAWAFRHLPRAPDILHNARALRWAAFSLLFPMATALSLRHFAGYRTPAPYLVLILAVESAVYFAIPALSWPQEGRLELGGVRYLQSRLGLERFYTLRDSSGFPPASPPYGIAYKIAQINYTGVPHPLLTTQFVHEKLDPATSLIHFPWHMEPGVPSPIAELKRHLRNYERAGVKYVLVPPGPDESRLVAAFRGGPALPRVFRDEAMSIYELPHPAPYFSASNCALRAVSRDEVSALCLKPARLKRLEVYMPGWSASVNGAPAAISKDKQEPFQILDLPAGRSEVAYAYRPPGIAPSAFLGALGGVLFAVGACRVKFPCFVS